MKKGTYVLATKYSDGDPMDHWCVGFYDSHTKHKPKRHLVVDNEGNNFRCNGFRVVTKISSNEGGFFISHANEIEFSDKGIYKWLYLLRNGRLG